MHTCATFFYSTSIFNRLIYLDSFVLFTYLLGATMIGDVPYALPELPRDAQRCIALAALRAEGDGLEAWLRLSLVNRYWRDCMEGARVSPNLPQTCCQPKPGLSQVLHYNHLKGCMLHLKSVHQFLDRTASS